MIQPYRETAEDKEIIRKIIRQLREARETAAQRRWEEESLREYEEGKPPV